MLEKWVAPLMMRLLGDYVLADCFDPGRVHLDVWSGEAGRAAAGACRWA
jgi:hypothetical protein